MGAPRIVIFNAYNFYKTFNLPLNAKILPVSIEQRLFKPNLKSLFLSQTSKVEFAYAKLVANSPNLKFGIAVNQYRKRECNLLHTSSVTKACCFFYRFSSVTIHANVILVVEEARIQERLEALYRD